jgi:hypothetical protein
MVELRVIEALTAQRNAARDRFFAHDDPGGLTPAFLSAWQIEHDALAELLRAAQIRLDAEIEIQRLLESVGWEYV